MIFEVDPCSLTSEIDVYFLYYARWTQSLALQITSCILYLPRKRHLYLLHIHMCSSALTLLLLRPAACSEGADSLHVGGTYNLVVLISAQQVMYSIKRHSTTP